MFVTLRDILVAERYVSKPFGETEIDKAYKNHHSRVCYYWIGTTCAWSSMQKKYLDILIYLTRKDNQ